MRYDDYDDYDRGRDYRRRDDVGHGGDDIFSDMIDSLIPFIIGVVVLVAAVILVLQGLGWIDGQLGTNMEPTVQGWLDSLRNRISQG